MLVSTNTVHRETQLIVKSRKDSHPYFMRKNSLQYLKTFFSIKNQFVKKIPNKKSLQVTWYLNWQRKQSPSCETSIPPTASPSSDSRWADDRSFLSLAKNKPHSLRRFFNAFWSVLQLKILQERAIVI